MDFRFLKILMEAVLMQGREGALNIPSFQFSAKW